MRRKPNGAKNLALLRGAILALIPQEKFTSLNAAFDTTLRIAPKPSSYSPKLIRNAV